MDKLEKKNQNTTVSDKMEFRGRRRKHVHKRGRVVSISLTIDGRRGQELHKKEKPHNCPPIKHREG